MSKKQFWAGVEIDSPLRQEKTYPLQFRQTFYDFNCILPAVFGAERAVIRLERRHSAAPETGILPTAKRLTSRHRGLLHQVFTASHLDPLRRDVGAGVMLFVTNHIFVKPQDRPCTTSPVSAPGSTATWRLRPWFGGLLFRRPLIPPGREKPFRTRLRFRLLSNAVLASAGRSKHKSGPS